ncbi:MAG TPA: GH1 family beta-glucosidase [Jatrophihabitans sp.]|jgi:beta-glucosidase|nr:GH1 family beta-glucosidase [Jatrophihabitans sp.]
MSDPTFPSDFLWGAATSAYQIEGSLDVDGRGRSIWETFAAQPCNVEGGGDGSRACDSYRRWGEDVDLVTELNLNAYRFSAAWARIMPEGRGRIETRGLDHYEQFVDALLARDVTPMVSLNHWDMPEALMADGGWAGRSSVDAFSEFAVAVADRLGDRVDWWITQNEPWIIALLGYQHGVHAPGVRDLYASVAAGHHVLLGHGAAADVIHERNADAKVGCTLSLFPCDPVTDDPADVEAAWGSDGYVNRWYLDPLLGKSYPDDTRGHYERALGRDLDEIIRPGDVELIGERSDYLGVNYYSRRVMAAAPDRQPFPWQVAPPRHETEYTDGGWEYAPDNLRRLLLRLHEDYPGVPLLVTENGAVYGDTPMHDGLVHDNRRTRFLLDHLRAIQEAMGDGADVRGYFYWSLLDNFEWALGYRPRFGLTFVDYATGKRTVKDSGRVYAEIARCGRLPESMPSIAPFG